MPPAFRLIASTALPAAGLGALAIVALADLGATYAGWNAVATRRTLALAAAIGLALVVAGRGAPAWPHLAHPREAWRTASRWRTSWPARELVFVLALLPVAAAWVAGLWLDVRPRRMWGLATGTLLLAWTVSACMAMVDASPKPMRQWPAVRVLLAFLVLGHASGAVIVEAVARPHSGATWVAAAGIALLVAALLVTEDPGSVAQSGAGSLMIEPAPGTGQGDAPAGRGPPAAPRGAATWEPDSRSGWVRAAFIVATGVVPALWLAAGTDDMAAGLAASIGCLAGTMAWRWRMLADARHTARAHPGDGTSRDARSAPSRAPLRGHSQGR